MKSIVCALLLLVSTVVRSRLSLQLEIVALRHQLAVYQRTTNRPQISSGDRILWSWLASRWTGGGCSGVCSNRDRDRPAAQTFPQSLGQIE